MIIHSSQAIFIQIHKNAGTSTLRWLCQHVDRKKWRAPLLKVQGEALTKHINLYPTYFLFTFIRNPYDRFISIYQHGQRMAQSYYYKHSIAADISAQEYAELIQAKAWEKLSESDYYHSKTQVSFLPDYNTQLHGVSLKHNLKCSFIGRFEHLKQDIKVLNSILGITTEKNTRLYKEKHGSTRTLHYSHFYNHQLRKIVEDIYAEDIEAFGYQFDKEGHSLPKNIPQPQVERSLHLHKTLCYTVIKEAKNMPKPKKKIQIENPYIVYDFCKALFEQKSIKKAPIKALIKALIRTQIIHLLIIDILSTLNICPRRWKNYIWIKRIDYINSTYTKRVHYVKPN